MGRPFGTREALAWAQPEGKRGGRAAGLRPVSALRFRREQARKVEELLIEA